MRRASRRTFLKRSGLGAAGATWALAGRLPKVLGANEQILVGVIGCGGRGQKLAGNLSKEENCRVAYVCDPDRNRLQQASKSVDADHAVTDLRQILDDRSVDAVVIATPDHWHAPAAILACEAGKHVYVEKPCSHNIREGRLMVDAARRYQRVMQVGTQRRSNPFAIEAMEMLRDGVIGDVLVAKAINSQLRRNIGHAEPCQPPDHIEYDLWVGPAPMVPYRPNLLHYNWHWMYNFGTGDIGNDGVHQLDVARWGLGVNGHPTQASGYGSKLFFEDDQQFPDTYCTTYEYPTDGNSRPKQLLIYEQRIWSPYRQEGMSNGNVFYGTEGMMLLGAGAGCQVFGPRDKPIKQIDEFPRHDELHQRDFLEAIRTGRTPNADIQIGHYAATVAHLGNIVSRVGRTVTFDPITEQIVADEEANKLVRREYRRGHWAVPKGV